ncbi:MBL fold metallo-hydrolase [Lyngbya sp. PCC 8106]|uniref:MBL fold metallo-hydrolase n=1 Tax=Lyngbya sp. (strain PCC 8106) TaxID=313612 RepID=UPI0000EAD5F8|nr:Beta-lactamase-like protein [Lyngbya sp. PCC 8106]
MSSVSDPPAQSQQPSEQAQMETNPSPDFYVKFWGVRGTIPTPGPQTVRYGGNTSCVEMRLGKKLLIFDAGTGLRVLGTNLLKEMPLDVCMFFSHTHWDHIQGFPFFIPAFIPINRFHIYGAITPDGSTIEQRLADQMVHPNFPVPMHVMQSDMKFYDIIPGEIVSLEDIKIETAPLNYPNGAIGYRVTWQGHTVVYCSDTEHFPDRLDENVLHLARGADVLIYDATYTNEEYYHLQSPKVGWGHSTWQVGVEVAKKAGVKKIVMYQHDPSHDDDFLDQVEADVQAVFPEGIVAREGMQLQIN